MNRFFYLSPLILQTAIWPIVRPLFRFFLRLGIKGTANLQRITYTQGTVFAVNHSSELDAILVPSSLPFFSPLMPMFYTSREQAFYKTSGWRQFFYGGFLFKLWGSHPVRSGKQNYEESLKTHIEILSNGKSVCIFPEGRKTKDGDIGREARGGVAYLAYRTGAPVMPVRIKAVFKMTFREFLFRKRAVEVIFGTPLFTAALFPKTAPPSLDEIKSAAHRILGAIQQL
jgi:1-acyl-sn-glycerol-3-phosphate acyltransferase